MGDRPTTRRILEQLGEDETLLSTEYTTADLKLFVPGFVLAFLVIGLVPDGWGLFGFGLGAIVMLGTAGIIWYAPAHRVAHKWLTTAVRHQIAQYRGQTLQLPHDRESAPDASRSLTHVDSVLPRWNAIERVDGALVGAVQVHPANMALADAGYWETAADGLADVVRNVSFDMQLYSTARPVDASAITAPYRERLDDPDVQDNERLSSVIKAYRDSLPEEFARRQTSVREYYILVAVSEADVRRSGRGVLDALHSAPGLGWVVSGLAPLVRRLGVSGTDLSEGELLVLQQRELQSRLQSVRQGVTELPECRPESVTAGRLTDLLEEFWTGEPTQHDDEPTSQRYHEVPIIQRDTERTIDDDETLSSRQL